ncbi:MAG: carotenoid biosynthesis protein [Patescibacteria group bacterium]|nr:carotenoid biosynthesis protein [Patescibacteria group bacterium]
MFIYLIQIVCFVLFGVLAVIALRRRELWTLFVATIYAAFFENLDIIISRGEFGSYTYDPHLILIVIQTPLFVILSWGIIFYSSFLLAKGLTRKFWIQALSVPLLATIIDLTMDPVATRLGLWSWQGYGAHDGILGVPLANFMGWYLVVFALMITLRLIGHIDFLGRTGRNVIMPIFSCGLFFIFFAAFSFTANAFGLNISNQFNFIQFFFPPVAAACIIGWILFPGKISISRSHLFWMYASRGLFYIFSVYGLIALGFWKEPVFIILLVFSLVIEIIAGIKFKINAKT